MTEASIPTNAAGTEPANPIPPVDLAGHVIICGLNDVGLRIVEQLHAAGEPVLVIDDGGNERLARVVGSLSVLRLQGDPRRTTTLLQAGIGHAAALVCAEDADLDNLAIALLARELAPEVRLVVQLSNTAVGRAVARLTGPGSVLDVATLAAPSFVEACLRRREHEFQIQGHDFVVVERAIERLGNLRSAFGDLAPIAVVPVDGSDIVVCPGRDWPVTTGDQVTLIGTPADFGDSRPRSAVRGTGTFWARPRRSARRIGRLTLSFFRETETSMRLALVALAAVAALSVDLLVFGYIDVGGSRMGVLDATYFTVQTLTTVGFGDFSYAHQPAWLRLWAIVLMIAGATLVTILYALLTNLLVTRRLAAGAGQRAAAGLRHHVVLVGLGSVGFRVLEGLLAAEIDVVVLEADEDNRYVSSAQELGVAVIIGDATLPQNLLAANLARAEAVAVLTSNDLANIETGLAVYDLLGERVSEVPVVLRVFDRQLASTIEKGFDFRHVRSTSALAAPWFVGAALGLTILNTFYVDAMPFLIGRLTVSDHGGLNGSTMLDLSARTRVIAISRTHGSGELEYPPRRDTRFEAGDQAFVVGPYEELLLLLRHEKDAR